jgi:hypothetical protein
MNGPAPSGWLEFCRTEGLDPAEVRVVLSRYRAYRSYYRAGRRGEPLPLANWFGFYRMETASEVGQQAPAPSGCSVDDDSRNRGAIRKPEAFLQALALLAAAGEEV